MTRLACGEKAAASFARQAGSATPARNAWRLPRNPAWLGRGPSSGRAARALQTMRRITPVIMCGGAGTRLWPSSRESFPKQFIPFFGPRSSFQDTVLRVSDPSLFGEPVIITGRHDSHLVADQLEGVGRTGTICSSRCAATGTGDRRRRELRCSATPGRCPRHGGRPRHPGRSGFPRRGPQRRPKRRPRATLIAVRHQARPRRDGLRLHPAERRLGSGRLRQGRSLRREAGLETPRPISPTAISGTPATSFSEPEVCSRSTASSTPRPSRRRSRPSSGRRRPWLRASLPPTRSARAAMSIDFAVMERSDRAGVVPVAMDWSDIGALDPDLGTQGQGSGTAMPGRTPPVFLDAQQPGPRRQPRLPGRRRKSGGGRPRRRPSGRSTGARATPSRSSWRG